VTAPTLAALPSPYKGLEAFEDSALDALFFFGREREIDVIAANLVASRLTVLYGPSGVGKSSVLRAGVARRLRAMGPDAIVVIDDIWAGDPVRSLVESLGAATAEVPPPSIDLLLADAVDEWTRRVGADLYLILDQFEEYFVYHRGEDGPGTLAFELPELVSRPGLRANVLLAVREDALSELDVFTGRISNVFRNSLPLDRLDRSAGSAAIEGPLARYNELAESEARVEIEPQLVEAVLDQVGTGRVRISGRGRGTAAGGRSGDQIEAPFLQLVMERLWEAEIERHRSRVLRRSTLDELGGAEAIVRRHLERAVETLGPTQRDLAARIFHHLVTPSGTKIAHRVSDLSNYAAVPEERLGPVLAVLGKERILRPMDGRFEIFHDVLAGAVLDWRTAHEARREIQRRHRRLAIVAGAALAALVVMAAVTVYALVQRSEAQGQARRAHARELAASALTQLSTDPELSLLLAREAAEREQTGQIEAVLRDALIASRVRGVLAGGDEPLVDASFSPDGSRILVAGGDGRARLYDAGSNRLLHTLDHGALLNSASFSPDGKTVLTGSEDGAARLWSVKNGRLVLTARHRAAVTSAQFSTDGKYVVTASADHTARIWDRVTGRRLVTLRHPEPVRAASLSGDARLALTVAIDGKARIFDVSAGRLRWRVPHRGVTGASFSPDGRMVVTTSVADNTARLWRTSTRTLTHTLQHREYVVSAVFSPDGRRLATAGGDTAARIWDVATGERIVILGAHLNTVNAAVFSPDGRFVVTASRDRTARIWDTLLQQVRAVAVLAGHHQWVTSAAFSPDGRRVVTASRDGTSRVWDLRGEEAPTLLGRHRFGVVDLSVSADGKSVLSASADGTARIWRLRPQRAVARLQHDGPVWSASFSSDNRLAATGSTDGTARIWRARDGKLVRTFRHGGPVAAVSLNADGSLLLTSGGKDGTLRLWESRSGALRRTLLHSRRLMVAGFDPDGELVITAGDHGVARLWDSRSGTLVHTLRGHRRRIVSASFSRRGDLLATASHDRTARVWSTESGMTRDVLRGHQASVTDVQFSPGGTVLATASFDGDARTWDVVPGKLRRILGGHKGGVTGVSFSSDGRWILTTGQTSARLWRSETGALLFSLRGDEAPLTAATFVPGRYEIVTASSDGTVRVYPCDVCGRLDALIALADRRLAATGRVLSPEERNRYLDR
jgi:WD40 repeat protein